MAQRTVVTVVCDLPHGGEVEGTESVSFAFDGNAYEIDLCGPHSKELREKIGAFADHQAGSAVLRSGSGRGSVATRSANAVAFPATSSPSTRRPTSRSALHRAVARLRRSAAAAAAPRTPAFCRARDCVPRRPGARRAAGSAFGGSGGAARRRRAVWQSAKRLTAYHKHCYPVCRQPCCVR